MLPSYLACLLVAGCVMFRPVNPSKPPEPTGGGETLTPTSPPPAAPAAPAPQAEEPRPVRRRDIGSDDEILAILLSSNYADISYARVAATRAGRTDIRNFAQRMLTDHTAVNALVTELATKLDLTPKDNVTSLDLRDESSGKRDMLRELGGYAFDSTYIENEIKYHRKFLATIDEALLPRARNGDLRALITSVRPAVAAHLAHAEQVRSDVLARK
jgi:putative membrane protein